MSVLQEEKRNLENYKKEIELLGEKIKNTTSDMEIWSLEQQMERLEKKVKSIENDGEMNNYFLRTGNILFDYYDVQQKIQQGAVVPTTQTKAKPGSILAILSDLQKDEEVEPTSTISSSVSTKHLQRNNLLNQYLQIEDPTAVLKPDTDNDDEWTHCDHCGKEMIMCMNEATMTCSSCGNKEFILIDSDKPSYKDPPRELAYYAYKKINHFNEWLAQFQAKESTEIPAAIYDQILLQLKKERISNFASLKRTKLREILRHMGETKYYEHIPHIINRLSGQNAPFMSREDEEKLRHMFREIQPAFKKHIPKGRRNFLSYGYILYKFCELLEMDEHLACFPLLKNRDKLYIQDQAWKGICADMKWQFIRTV
uniref:Late transcription factor VLTF3-like protein n=1 Tax=viral metagenome TaxID=1070528 RepID=A0A6C0ANZ3_9ZZZZ